MARLASKLNRHCPHLLIWGLPLGLGAGCLLWTLHVLEQRPLMLSKPLMEELLQSNASTKQSGQRPNDGAADLTIPPQGSRPELDIRVMLHKSEGSVEIAVGSKANRLRCRQGRLNQGSQPVGGERWFEAPAGQSVAVEDSRYRGRLQLFCQGDSLTVVNHVPLEDYIGSVVGAEMPSHWPTEALRAQAVAARSYAMAHLARPATRYWNLGATTRWQAYGGLVSESRTSRAATLSTRGLILSVDGGIVESLYASDRKLTVEAHGHLGASMSQQGARTLARKGYQFTQILAKYYPGASLARLQRS